MENEDEILKPGRYTSGMGDGTVGVVLAVVQNKAYGYFEHFGTAGSANDWNINGVFGDGSHPFMNLLRRIEEVEE